MAAVRPAGISDQRPMLGNGGTFDAGNAIEPHICSVPFGGSSRLQGRKVGAAEFFFKNFIAKQN